MASRFRPQSKVLIKLYNINKDDESVDDIYIWETKDIIDFEYERQIDPLGRENSSIVFRWKERYKGAKNIYGEAEKYKNLKVGCKVELTIFQSLGFKTQWEQLFNSNRKWKDLFEAPMTWKNVFQNSLFEPIKLPTVFLYALPKYTNDVIEWEARDILSFMANNFVYYIPPKNTEKPEFEYPIGEPRYVRDIADLLFSDNYNYLTIRYLASAFEQCRENAKELSYMYNNEEVDIIACLIQEPSIDALRKIVAVYGGYYCDFNLDGSVKFKSILKNDWYTNTNITITRNTMYKEPKLIKPIYAQSITSQYYNYTPNYDSPVKVKNDGWLYSGDFDYSTFFKYPQYATAYKKKR